MKRHLILLTAAITALISCNGVQKNNNGNGCDTIPDATSICNNDTLVVAGQIIMGHEVCSFKADNDTSEYWFNDKTGKLTEMYEKAAPDGMKNYTPVKAELKIVKKGKSDEGFAAEYEGTIDIVEIISVESLSK